jgi:hypothetical protein
MIHEVLMQSRVFVDPTLVIDQVWVLPELARLVGMVIEEPLEILVILCGVTTSVLREGMARGRDREKRGSQNREQSLHRKSSNADEFPVRREPIKESVGARPILWTSTWPSLHYEYSVMTRTIRTPFA